MIYDAIIVGGGLAGSTLARSLAERGYRVVVLEQEREFKDRVRGEQMHPWGVSAARKLGIYDPLARICGNQTRWWTTWLGGVAVFNRDLESTTPHGAGSFNIYHPAMQEALVMLAEKAGAEVRRGIRVSGLVTADNPSVQFTDSGKEFSLTGRIVVGADGRMSGARSWAGFETDSDPDRLMIAGLLLEGVPAPENATHLGVGPAGNTLVAPLGQGRSRLYFMYRKADGPRELTGPAHIPEFLACCRHAGIPGEWLDGVSLAGPLAQFNGADHWVPHPARNGVVLVGDAATSTDPDWGTGLSLTLWDVLHLRDALCESADWRVAVERYAVEHDRYYSVLHQVTRCFAELLWSTGQAADERRSRVLPSLLTNPVGVPDVIGLGPESPVDDGARRLFFGETQAASV
jgi:2-polyprenyl-6-methoxyphenol hydroxylase-like FAD-dependent oxidoreductase